jgi:FlaG/FlaF family flagellin (archaellin)
MVAITVILAAVIAAFVLDLGDSSDPAPQVSFDYNYNKNENNLTVTVESGDTFAAGNVDVTNATTGDLLGGEGNSPFGESETVSAGDSFTVGNGTVHDGVVNFVGRVAAEERVDITFTPEEGGESSIIGTFEAPEE